MKLKQRLLLLLAKALVLFVVDAVHAADQVAVFTAQPERCIALNRGQVCYQRLRFKWQTAAGARYCLYQDALPAPLVCWNGNERSGHELEFASDRNVVYGIRREGETDNLAQVEVEVAWVYQSNRNGFSRWRLF